MITMNQEKKRKRKVR